MLGFSTVFLLATGMFYSFGFQDSSLIYANIVNLSMRIIYAAKFISNYYTLQHANDLFSWSLLAPRIWTISVTIGIALISQQSAKAQHIDTVLQDHSGIHALLSQSVMIHGGIGVGLAVLFVATWWGESGQHLLAAL
jgi:oligosaccharide translocation protein RFT1